MRFNTREAQRSHRLPCFRSILEQSNSIKLLNILIVFAIHDMKISMELFVDSVTKINIHTWLKISRNTPIFKDSIIDINLWNKFRTFVYNATICIHFLFHSNEFLQKCILQTEFWILLCFLCYRSARTCRGINITCFRQSKCDFIFHRIFRCSVIIFGCGIFRRIFGFIEIRCRGTIKMTSSIGFFPIGEY